MNFVENLSLCSDLKSTLWTSREEAKSYKYHFAVSVREMKKVLDAVAKGDKGPANNVDIANFMGLENFMTESSHLEVQARRIATQRAVLMEQRHQAKIGIYDPDSLAVVSAEKTEWARKRSQFYGTLHDDR